MNRNRPRRAARGPALLIGLLAGLGSGGGGAPAAAQGMFTLGSGELDGGYYAAARALCARVNRAGPAGPRCSPESTPGSLYNLRALRDHELDLALVQSDWHRHAYEGTDAFAAAGPMRTLRSVMALYPETVTLLAREGVEIDAVGDLRGRRIDVGRPASGRRATAGRLLAEAGLGPDDFAEFYELDAGSAVAELCAGRLDATILVVGHPNAAVARALAQCGARIAPLDGPEVRRLIDAGPDYRSATVPALAYPGAEADVASFAVTATVVARADADPAAVAALVTATLDGLGPLAARTSLLAGLAPETMRETGLTAPLHPAAEAAFAASAGD